MTRTPPDMETAMSDEAPTEVSPEVKAALANFLSSWDRFNNRERPDQRETTLKCYAACAAINPDNPAVVAEALPELVDAAEEALKDYCVLQGNIAASMKVDPNWEGMWDELSKRKKALRSVLSKLKARP